MSPRDIIRVWVKYPPIRERNYRLAECIEIIQKALIRYDRTLGNEGRTVGIICVMLKDTVPMLQKEMHDFLGTLQQGRSYDRGGQIQRCISQLIGDGDFEFLALQTSVRSELGSRESSCKWNPTLYAEIIGPGKA